MIDFEIRGYGGLYQAWSNYQARVLYESTDRERVELWLEAYLEGYQAAKSALRPR